MWIVARREWIIYNQCSDVCLYSVGCLGHQNWDQMEAGLALVHIRVKQSCYRFPLHPFAHTRLLGNGLWHGNIPVPFCKTPAKPEGSLRYVWDIQGMLTVSPLLTAVSSPLAAVISQRPSSLSVFLTKYNRWGKSWNSHLEVKHIYSTFHGHHPHVSGYELSVSSSIFRNQDSYNLFLVFWSCLRSCFHLLVEVSHNESAADWQGVKRKLVYHYIFFH